MNIFSYFIFNSKVLLKPNSICVRFFFLWDCINCWDGRDCYSTLVILFGTIFHQNDNNRVTSRGKKPIDNITEWWSQQTVLSSLLFSSRCTFVFFSSHLSLSLPPTRAPSCVYVYRILDKVSHGVFIMLAFTRDLYAIHICFSNILNEFTISLKSFCGLMHFVHIEMSAFYWLHFYNISYSLFLKQMCKIVSFFHSTSAYD